MYVEGAPRTPRFTKSGQTLPAKVFLNPGHGLKQRASTSDLIDGDLGSPRPRLQQSKTHPSVLRLQDRKKIRSSFYGEWRAPKWEDEEEDDEPETPDSSAEKHAADYTDVMKSRESPASSSLTPEITLAAFDTDESESPDPLIFSPLTAAIKAAFHREGDNDVVPPFLRCSTASEEYMPSSCWSSTSSGPGSPIQLPKKIFRFRTQKAFLAQKAFTRKHSPEKADKKRHRREESNSSWASHSSGDSNDSAAVEKGIMNIFDTLNAPYNPASSAADVNKPEKTVQKDGKGSTKTPSSLQQPSRSAHASWSTQHSVESRTSVSCEYRDTVLKHSFPREAPATKENSVGNRLVTAVGLNKEKKQKKASEKKRQDMKKKIVVVNPKGAAVGVGKRGAAHGS